MNKYVTDLSKYLSRLKTKYKQISLVTTVDFLH
jgi:hypothetical protein